jgi:hypothetical protein
MGDAIPSFRAHVGACSGCGKVSYVTRRDARRAGKTFHPDARTSVYQCGQLWHVSTSLAPRWTFRSSRA